MRNYVNDDEYHEVSLKDGSELTDNLWQYKRLKINSKINSNKTFKILIEKTPHITHLILDINEIDLREKQKYNLLNYLNENQNLVFLSLIIRNEINHTEPFASQFSTFPMLHNESLEFFKIQYSGNDELFSYSSDNVDVNNIPHQYRRLLDPITQIAKGNKSSREFIDRTKDYVNKIKKSQNKSDSNIDLMIKLSELYDKYNELRRGRLLRSKDLLQHFKKEGFLKLFEGAENWYPPNSVSSGSSDKIETLIKKNIITHENINTLYEYGLGKRRLIDIAAHRFNRNEKSGSDIINTLFKLNPCMTTIPNDTDIRYSHETHNFILQILKSSNIAEVLNNFPSLLNRTEVIYDALAFLLSTGHEFPYFQTLFNDYEKITKTKLLVEQPIEAGIFKGSNLFQVYLLNFHKLHNLELKDKIFNLFFRRITKHLPAFMNIKFPPSCTEVAGLTILQYILLNPRIELITWILNLGEIALNKDCFKLDLDELSDSKHILMNQHNLLQIFVVGIVEMFRNDEIHKNEEELESWCRLLKKMFNFLRNKVDNINQLTITNIDDNNKIPILHYLFMEIPLENPAGIDLLLFLVEQEYFNLTIETNIRGFDKINALTAMIIFNHKDIHAFTENIKSIMQYNSLLDMIFNKIVPENPEELLLAKLNTNLLDYHNLTLFQIAMIQNRLAFLQFCLRKFDNCPINEAFPETSEYSKWTPIQIAVFLAKRDSANGLIDILFLSENINLSCVYPSGFLQGLNILQAVVLGAKHDPDHYASRKETGKNDVLLKKLIEKLDKNEINTLCNDLESNFYGYNALHLAAQDNNGTAVKVLLKSEKVDYTLKNMYLQNALDITNSHSFNTLSKFIKDYQKQNPRYQNEQSYFSDIYSPLKITRENWVLSIVRFDNSDHVFLTIEGLEENKEFSVNEAKLWCAHLYLPTSNIQNRKSEYARVEFPLPVSKRIDQKQRSLLLDVDMKLIDFKTATRFFPESVNVSRKRCEQLISNLKEDADKEHKYSWGGTSSFGFFKSIKENFSSISASKFDESKISGSKNGNNCVTWAIKHYNQTVEQEKFKIKKDWSSYIVANARSFLNDQFQYTPTVLSPDKQIDQIKKELALVKDQQAKLTFHQRMTSSAVCGFFFSSLYDTVKPSDLFRKFDKLDTLIVAVLFSMLSYALLYKLILPNETRIGEANTSRKFVTPWNS